MPVQCINFPFGFTFLFHAFWAFSKLFIDIYVFYMVKLSIFITFLSVEMWELSHLTEFNNSFSRFRIRPAMFPITMASMKQKVFTSASTSPAAANTPCFWTPTRHRLSLRAAARAASYCSLKTPTATPFPNSPWRTMRKFMSSTSASSRAMWRNTPKRTTSPTRWCCTACRISWRIQTCGSDPSKPTGFNGIIDKPFSTLDASTGSPHPRQ